MLEIDLIEKCKQNNRKAQMKLYNMYCDAMYCIAMRYVKNADDAKDVMQESFIKAFKKLDQFKAEVTFGSWLKRIVINKSIDFLKSKRQHFVSLNESFVQLVDDENWEMESPLDIADVKFAINKLPDKYRYVVMLYLIEGYDHEEISQILEITNTTSRTHLLRGKQKLQSLLKERAYGTGY
ncbi:RNA polymerase sigma factor [Galbibacter pacificus]|uniref:RNA polymerase sigma factor n=1 Tax=Galbibacter pacificus TaxID=2996052 RepID=A0ABT6FUX0_9FLAO|nr:RNA polymerase sigma factor [Galbibacter pacificus]MDG3583627.1 RNA polymerase sigma factor [Galbibacter pacificus]MDG3586897.1 RNA polymerase sigma factor [Galbibacter pacificus]